MSESATGREYPGVDRLQYFMGKIGIIVAMVLIAIVFGPGGRMMQIAGLAALIGGILLDVMRLKNIGTSQWFAFIRFLPFGNTILDICLQSAQTGWIETRRLDDTGKRIFTFELILIGVMLFIFLFFRARMEMPFYF